MGFLTTSSKSKKAEALQEDQQNYEDSVPPPPAYQESNTQLVPSKPSAYPAQPHHTQAPVHTLHAKWNNWTGTKILIYDTDESNSKYHVKCQMVMYPHMRFTRADSSNDDEVATANFHCFRSKTDLTIRGEPLTMKTRLAWSMTYYAFDFNSRVLPGNPLLKWKARSSSTYNIVCVDQSTGMTIARFFWGKFGRSKYGTMEILSPAAQDPTFGRDLVDELTVSGLSYVHYVLFMTLAANNSASTSAATAIAIS